MTAPSNPAEVGAPVVWPPLVDISRTIAFFASAIKSGEPWTATCQQEYEKANLAIKALALAPSPPIGDTGGVGEVERERWRANLQAHAAAQRMVREAIETLFGPIASLESDDAVLLRGPEPHHTAEAFIAALQRVAAALVPARVEAVDHIAGKMVPEIIDALIEASNQIEYLHGKFQETGSGNAVITKLAEVRRALQGNPS